MATEAVRISLCFDENCVCACVALCVWESGFLSNGMGWGSLWCNYVTHICLNEKFVSIYGINESLLMLF